MLSYDAIIVVSLLQSTIVTVRVGLIFSEQFQEITHRTLAIFGKIHFVIGNGRLLIAAI